MMASAPSSPGERVRREARAWVVRLAGPEVEAEDHAAFDVWLADDDAHGVAYAKALRLYSIAGDVAGRFAAEPRKRAGRVWLSRSAWAGAAVAALAACLALFVLPHDLIEPAPSAAYATRVAQTREVVLADGSHVTLGAASRLEEMFGDGERRVRLSGEGDAYFDVVHDPARPFVVETPRAEVRVLGTAFEVKSTPTLVRVSVARGAVQVTERARLETLLRGARRHVVAAGEEVVLAASPEASTAPEAIAAPTAPWRQGFLSYENATLAEVVSDANRYSARPVRLADPALGNIRVTASYPTNAAAQLLDSLDASLPIRVRDEGAQGLVIEAER